MSSVARAALVVATALGAAGCVAKLMELHLDAAVRAQLGQAPPIHVFHYVPKPLDLVRSGLEPKDVFYELEGLDDPVAELERAFLEAVRQEAGWSNLVASDWPYWSQRRSLPRGVTWERATTRYGQPMTRLPPAWFQDGLVIEFETLNWRIDGSGPKRLLGKCTLQYGARGRLVRLSDDEDLWRGWYSYVRPGKCEELYADELKLVKELRAEIARRGAAELVGSLMGRTDRSLLDGSVTPKPAPQGRPGAREVLLLWVGLGTRRSARTAPGWRGEAARKHRSPS